MTEVKRGGGKGREGGSEEEEEKGKKEKDTWDKSFIHPGHDICDACAKGREVGAMARDAGVALSPIDDCYL